MIHRWGNCSHVSESAESGYSRALIIGIHMRDSRFEKLFRQHERLRRAHDNAIVWCAMSVLLFIPSFASLVQELSNEAEPRVAGEVTLIVLAVPVIFWTSRSWLRHHRALKVLSRGAAPD